MFCKGRAKAIRNLKGNYNINDKIVQAVKRFPREHPKSSFDVYICIDQEREGSPSYNHDFVLSKISEVSGFQNLQPAVATLMIESLFFIDIENIYKFLRAPHSKRSPKKFRNFRKLTHVDLQKLFASFKKHYAKGHRVEGLVRALDLEKLLKGAEELQLLAKSICSIRTKYE